MNIDFNAAFDAGMDKEDIKRMIEKQLQDAETAYVEKKAKKEEALRQNKENKSAKEALKAEGRAYLINALIAYSQAFDLLDEDEEWGQEEVDRAEEAIKKLEEMIPLYIKLAEMQGDMDKHFGLDGDIFFKGMF
jgi:alpha-mannosidase